MSYNDLESILDEYNWDDGFDIPKQILNDPVCDLAMALEIFYLADGFAYLEHSIAEGELSGWEKFIGSLYDDIVSGRYRKNNNQYKIPLSKVQKHKLKQKQIADIFLTDL